MKEIYVLSSFLAVSVVIAFVFVSRVLAIDGVNPNLPLLFFAWLSSFPPKKRIGFRSFLFLLVVFSCAVFFMGKFWLPEIIILDVVLFICFYASKFLTANWFLDFLIVQIAAALIFYGVSAVVVRSPFAFPLILLEMVYGIVISLVVWPIARKTIATL
jgi:hypothetical protein